MPMRSELLQTAAKQHGVIHRSNLATIGFSRGQISRLRRDGLLIPIGHTTYRAAGWSPTTKLALMAACLETGGVASHGSSVRMHRVGRWPDPHLPEVMVHRSRMRFDAPQAIVHTTTRLPPDDIVDVDGIPCTSVARTMLSLAGTIGLTDPERVRDLVDEAIRDRKASDPWLWWRLERLRCRGRSGVAVLEAILIARAGGERTESWLEREFLRVLADHGVGAPTCQQRIQRRGSFVGRVDFAYEDLKVVIEVSGHEFHASRDQLARDARRRNELQLAGYQILEFTYDQIVRDPEHVVAVVRQALASRVRSEVR